MTNEQSTSKKDNDTVPPTNLEQDTWSRYLSEDGHTESDSRYDIVVISYRKRKHDPDGVSVKAILDGCVREGILPEDNWDEIYQVTFRSIKCEKGQEEITVIEFWQEEGEDNEQ